MSSISIGPETGVIVTGGASGIGKATVFALAEAGRPVAAWDLNAAGAAAAAKEASERFGVAAIGIGIDVADTAAFATAIAESRATMGSIGGLVHGAGITGPGSVEDVTEEIWDRTLGIHLRAGAMLIRDLVPDLTRNAESAVVVISSIEGIVAHAAIVSYCSAKAGLLGLARSSAAHLGSRGVRVNAICPGFIETPMFAAAVANADVLSAYLDRIPLKRLGRPDDIARTARFLLSSDAAYITAAEIVVDGGVTRTTF
ncbi:MAG: SDR family oxidoreductase [Deltaproteobacteria bacterium]|nr:SDR family oxidoreductase [Deltaproteobacteria bacterium]